ncbi:MAG: OFA family MFS transporter [Cloacibacterium sp.]|nr:OFA family MFS transporter [Cloacibacterium sp.]
MQNSGKRWFIAVMATLVHLCLGTVYAWSFFQKTVSETFGWSNSETAWAFSLAIFMLGVTASWGGQNLQKFGPRKLALIGAFLYAFGYIISYFALQNESLWLLYFGYGIVGGIGLGLAYVTPVATVSKWFPDKQGLVTGMVVMGFGLGALLMSKLLAPIFLEYFEKDLAKTFLAIGITLLVLLPFFANFLNLPVEEKTTEISAEKLSASKEILSPNFIFIWLIFMFNVVAGMIFISFQSPLLQDLLKAENVNIDTATLEKSGATLIAISALFNGLGRFFWGSISDKLGRVTTFRLLLLIEMGVFASLIFIKSPVLFSVGVCLILLNYGGGFGVLPSLIKDFFGTKLMPIVYGAALTAWGVGGILGPQITAYMKDHFSEDAGLYAYKVALVLIALGIGLSFFVKNKKAQ